MDQGLANLQWAFAFVDGLAAAGVRHAVISPGSRSTPLVLACDRHPAISTRVLLDERSAAFFALGMAKAGGAPSAVIATSGSAPAHWLPAVVEAARASIPLLLLSADRPPEVQDWGANQTVDQQRLFGSHVRAFHQAAMPRDTPQALAEVRLLGVKAAQRSRWPDPGPVHVNLPFAEPLVPMAPCSDWPHRPGPTHALARPRLQPPRTLIDDLAGRLDAGPGLLVCGPMDAAPGFARAATELALRLSCPLLADPLSGLRFGPWHDERLLSRYDTFLAAGPPPEPDWILRFGAAPVSKTLLQWLARSPAHQIVVRDDAHWPDPTHTAALAVRADPAGLCRDLCTAVTPRPAGGFARAWLAAEQTAAQVSPSSGESPFEDRIVAELIDTLPQDAVLFSANSQPVRQLDAWSGAGSRHLRILCNRGASGIDGNLATLLGIAATAQGPVVGLLGDLTVVHDLSSLSAAAELDAVLIVLNNGGGGIFEHLPQAALSQFETYWLTPQRIALENAARLYGVAYRAVRQGRDFVPALQDALARPGVTLVEIFVDRRASLQAQRERRLRIVAAIESGKTA